MRKRCVGSLSCTYVITVEISENSQFFLSSKLGKYFESYISLVRWLNFLDKSKNPTVNRLSQGFHSSKKSDKLPQKNLTRFILLVKASALKSHVVKMCSISFCARGEMGVGRTLYVLYFFKWNHTQIYFWMLLFKFVWN